MVLHNDDYFQGFVVAAGIEGRQDCTFGGVFGIRCFCRSHHPDFLRPQERDFSLFKASSHPHYLQIGWIDCGSLEAEMLPTFRPSFYPNKRLGEVFARDPI